MYIWEIQEPYFHGPGTYCIKITTKEGKEDHRSFDVDNDGRFITDVVFSEIYPFAKLVRD